MKKRKRSFYSLVFGMLLSTAQVAAQLIGSNNLPSVLPPGPSAAEFLKYGEVPISKYTGLSNISVPIYDIQAKGMTIPINLSYHSSGFKVNEEAGWTGLAWSLNTGGSIIQIVNSFDDFGPFKNRDFPDIDEIANVASNGYVSSGVLDGCNGTFIGIDDSNFSLPISAFEGACGPFNGETVLQ